MTESNAKGLAALHSTWNAGIRLRLARTSRGVRLIDAQHNGPLYVQKAFYPEGPDLAHIYLLHPPGGLVSGDNLTIKVALENEASALLTTPGAGRLYRARQDGAVQSQRVVLEVSEGGSVEWLPLETIVFNQAKARLINEVKLAQDATYMGWEITSLGLPARGETFDRGSFHQSLRVSVESELRLQETLRLSGGESLMHTPIGLSGRAIQGLFVAGPFSKADAAEEDVLAALREQAAEDANILSGVTLVSGFLVGRALGDCSEGVRQLFQAWRRLVRPVLLKRDSIDPRIWLT